MKSLQYSLLAVILTTVAAKAQAVGAGPDTGPVKAQPTATDVINCGAFAARDANLVPISKLCDFALTYRAKLPDFVAQQTTTSTRPGGKVVIHAQVSYYEGLEHYSQIAINGKALAPKKSRERGLTVFCKWRVWTTAD